MQKIPKRCGYWSIFLLVIFLGGITFPCLLEAARIRAPAHDEHPLSAVEPCGDPMAWTASVERSPRLLRGHTTLPVSLLVVREGLGRAMLASLILSSARPAFAAGSVKLYILHAVSLM